MMTVPSTFLWSGVSSGVKKDDKLDLALAYSSFPATVAGVFTSNSFAAAPVREARERLEESREYHGLVVNSGVANAATGQQGIDDNREVLREAAGRFGIDESEVLSASTGHIGENLPVQKINEALPEAIDTLDERTDKFARAILTTDSTTKEVSKELPELDATMKGIAKGAGMIRPNMATMLVFIFLDHPVDSDWWQAQLQQSTETSFNRITVDGEMSTNDTVLAFASNRPDREPVDGDHDRSDLLAEKLYEVCDELAHAIVSDGEGATRLIDITVDGARNEELAREVAESIAGSNLLKAAYFGGDPNWGRVYSAIGATGRDLNAERITIAMDGYTVFDPRNGVRDVPEDLKEEMASPGNHQIDVDLGDGNASASKLTCDLTDEYISINADYEP